LKAYRVCALAVQADLALPQGVDRVAKQTLDCFHRLDLVVHAAGAFASGKWSESDHLDALLALNLEAPARLTRLLLPRLRASRGQIVFVNSSQGLTAGEGVGAYAASKHALKALADSLRQEVNETGVRVLTIYPGSTATPMQARIRESKGLAYDPLVYLQPADIASMVVAATSLPRTAEVTDIIMRPMKKPA